MSAIRVSGMNSGLDTDSIVQALVMDVKSKKESYEKKKTKLEWTQDAWKSLNSKVYSLYNKVGNLRWSTSYNLKKTTVSDSTKASVSASNTAVTGTQKLNILSVAQSGYLTGGKLSTASNTKTTLAELGYTGGEGTINVDKGDGTSASITVSATTTIDELTTALGKQGLNASLDTTNNRIFISSKETGVKNDFNLIAGDAKGLEALKSLGLTTSLGDSTTQATYKKYGTYAMTSDGQIITDEDTIKANIEAARTAYKNASTNYNTYTTQISNIKAAQTYGSAYAATQDFYATYGIAETDKLFQSLASKSSGARDNTVVNAGVEYTKISQKDSDGNEIYSYKNADGSTSYLKKVETYVAKDGNIYSKKDDGTYVRKDGDTEVKYDGDTADFIKNISYYAATEKVTATVKNEEGNDVTYEIKSRTVGEGAEAKTQYYFETEDAEGNKKEYVSDTIKGDFKNGDETINIGDVKYDYVSNDSDLLDEAKSATTLYGEYKTQIVDTLKAGGKSEADAKAQADTILSTFTGNLATVTAYEKQARDETDADKAAAYDKTELMDAIKDAYGNGGATAVTTLTNGYIEKLATITPNQNAASMAMKNNEAVAALAELEEGSSEYATALEKMVQTAKMGATVLTDTDYKEAAVKIDGTDAKIKLNGVEYTNATNNVTVNGITISAMGVTGDGDENAITISTQTDTQGIYDKIKEFISEYNKVINELTKQYNAEYVKDFEPLTDDEKEEMSDKEIEKWEEKIKGSLLRHDSTVSGLINSMTSAMFGTVNLNGKNYSLASFGIQTLGYLNAAKNEQYAYHIDGDADDDSSSGKTDKLMAMINSDPDTVVDFFKALSTNLYKSLDSKMKSTSMNSAYTVYKDKQMTKDMDNYKKLIKQWEDKLADREDYYYKKFTAMEKAMASLNSTQTSLSGYFQ